MPPIPSPTQSVIINKPYQLAKSCTTTSNRIKLYLFVPTCSYSYQLIPNHTISCEGMVWLLDPVFPIYYACHLMQHSNLMCRQTQNQQRNQQQKNVTNFNYNIPYGKSRKFIFRIISNRRDKFIWCFLIRWGAFCLPATWMLA